MNAKGLSSITRKLVYVFLAITVSSVTANGIENSCADQLGSLRAYFGRPGTAGGYHLIYLVEVLQPEPLIVTVRNVVFDHVVEIEGRPRVPGLVGQKISFSHRSPDEQLKPGEKRYFLVDKGGVNGGGLLFKVTTGQGSIKPICFGEALKIINAHKEKLMRQKRTLEPSSSSVD